MVCRTLALGLLAFVLGSASASAATFVSGTGTDSGTCAQTAPCRTFNYAMTKTPAKGQIIVVAPGIFPAFNITKALTIENDGVGTASIVPANGNAGITVQAGASDAVQLRGLAFDGQGVNGTTGISVTSAGSLTVLDSTFKGLQNRGIDVQITNTVVTIDQSSFTDVYVALELHSRGTVSNTKIFNYTVGLETQTPNAFVSVDRCVISNGQIGIAAGNGFLVVKDSTISLNTTNGVQVSSSGYVWLGHNIITGNMIGLDGTAPTIVTYGDNYINGNTSMDTKGTIATSPVTR